MTGLFNPRSFLRDYECRNRRAHKSHGVSLVWMDNGSVLDGRVAFLRRSQCPECGELCPGRATASQVWRETVFDKRARASTRFHSEPVEFIEVDEELLYPTRGRRRE